MHKVSWDDRYAEGAKTDALCTPRPPTLIGSEAWALALPSWGRGVLVTSLMMERRVE